VPWGKLSL